MSSISFILYPNSKKLVYFVGKNKKWMACIMKMIAHNLQNNIDKLHFVFCFNNGGQCN